MFIENFSTDMRLLSCFQRICVTSWFHW